MAVAARDVDPDDEPLREEGAEEEEKERDVVTIRERVRRCCSTCNVFEVGDVTDPFTGEVTEEERWMSATVCDLNESGRMLGAGAFLLENYYSIFVPVDLPEPWVWSRFLIGSGAARREERRRYDQDFGRAVRPDARHFIGGDDA